MGDAGHIVEAVVREMETGRGAALCVVVATRGSTPQAAGAMLCVDEAARITGTLGGGCVEADIRRRAHQLLSDRRSELLTFELDHDFGMDDGMICGGQMDVAVSILSSPSDVESFRNAADRLRAGEGVVLPIRVDRAKGRVEYRIHLEAAPQLVIVGAGHISRVLASMCVPLGFCVQVIDDRGDYANSDRFGPPIETTVGDIAATLEEWPVGPNTYIVIVTRGHKHDEAALQAVLGRPAKYIGMIGSRRKIDVVFDDLRHGGATDAQLSGVHAPIGVDIGAVSTVEIALSICAELVSVRRAGQPRVVEGPIPIEDASA